MQRGPQTGSVVISRGWRHLALTVTSSFFTGQCICFALLFFFRGKDFLYRLQPTEFTHLRYINKWLPAHLWSTEPSSQLRFIFVLGRTPASPCALPPSPPALPPAMPPCSFSDSPQGLCTCLPQLLTACPLTSKFLAAKSPPLPGLW